MLKLTIVVATVLLNVVKSQPINVGVDVTVNGVSQDPPQATDLNHRSGIIDPGFGGLHLAQPLTPAPMKENSSELKRTYNVLKMKKMKKIQFDRK